MTEVAETASSCREKESFGVKQPGGLEIPIDIICLIFSYLPPPTLSACCRLSKRTHSTAFDALYRHVKPTTRNILDIIFRLSQPLFNSSIDDAPVLLATKVHSFVLSETKSSFDMYLGNIQDLLPKLTRLKVLVLDLAPTSGWVLPKHSTTPPFRLNVLHCSLQYDTTLREFLHTQTEIRTLVIRAQTHEEPESDMSLLPKMTFLQAPWKVAKHLLPGRPVSDLITWQLNMNSAREPPLDGFINEATIDLSSLSSTTAEGGLKRLFINWSFLCVAEPEKTGQEVPNLQRLSVDADGVDPSDETGQDEMVEYLTKLLTYTKSLQSVFIRFHPLRSIMPCEQIDFSNMVSSIFTASKGIKDVVITFLGLKARYHCRRSAPGEEWSIVNE